MDRFSGGFRDFWSFSRNLVYSKNLETSIHENKPARKS